MRRSFLLLLLAQTLAHELFYMAVLRPWQGPDEPGHFEYVALTYTLRRVPAAIPNTETVPELIRALNASAEENRYELFNPFLQLKGIRSLSEQDPPVLISGREAGYQPSAYYLLLLPVYAIFRNKDILTQYYALALVSSLLAVVTVLAAGMTVQVLFPKDAFMQVWVPVLVAFWPTQTFMMSRLNNDNLATAVAALAMWLIAALLKDGLNWRKGFTLGILALLAVFTKGTTLFLLPVMALALLLSVANRLGERIRRMTEMAIAATVALGALLVVLATMLPRVAGALAKATEVLLWPGRSRRVIVAMLNTMASGQHWQSEQFAAHWRVLIFFAKTFMAPYFWSDINLAPLSGLYWFFGTSAALAAVGLLWTTRRYLFHSKIRSVGQGQTLALFGLTIPLACLPVLASMILYPTVELYGRILLTLLIPMSIFLALGFRNLLPERLHKTGVQVMMALMLIVDTVVLALAIVPHYYGR
jgi:hypothetical protein